MADVKNFGLKGVAADLQMGKGGGRLLWDGSKYLMTTDDGSTLAELRVAAPTSDNSSASKAYVDSVASGLDPKASVQVATTADLAGTYAAGSFTAMNTVATIDGYTLQVGDRVLLKDQTGSANENGIYEVLTVHASTGTMDRAADQDGTPANEVSAGNFCFVENGTANADTGWVLQGSGLITLDTDPLNWVQFSGAGSFTDGDGLTKTGNILDLDFSASGGMTAAAATAGADLIAFSDTDNSEQMQARSWTNVLIDLDIVTATSNGILVRTTDDNYTSRTITADTDALNLGIVITDGDGIAGNPTIGLDLAGLTAATPALGDLIVLGDLDDATPGKIKKATIQGIVDLVAAETSDNEISLGDTSVVITDTGVDGTITFTADSNVSLTLDDTTAAFSAEITSDGDIQGLTLTATSLVSTGVVYNATGELATEAAFNYTAASDTLAVPNITGTSNIITGAFTTSAGDITATLGNVIAGADVQGLTLTATGLTDTAVVYNASGELTSEAAFSYVTATNTLSFDNWAGTSGIISGDMQAATLTATTLTTTGVVYNTSGELATEAAFTYNAGTDTLAVVNITGASIVMSGDVEGATLTATGLTTGRVVFNSSGELTDDAAFTYTTTNDVLTVGDSTTGGFTFTGTGQTIAGLEANADINIVPNGTGEVIIGSAGDATLASDATYDMTLEGKVDLFLQSGTGDVYIQDKSTTTAETTAQFTANTDSTVWLQFFSDTAANGASIGLSDGAATNADITFLMGSTSLLLVDDASSYATKIDSAADDAALVTKGWVDSAITSGASEEAVKSMVVLLDFTHYSATATGGVSHVGGVPDANQIALLGTDLGKGYESAPTFTQDGGGTGINCVLTATIDGSGIINGLTAAGGTGYNGDETWTIDTAHTSFSALPAKATVLRIMLDVWNDSDNAATTITFGYTGSESAFADDTLTDPANDGLYAIDVWDYNSGAITPWVVHSTEPSSAASVGYATLEYRVPLAAELTLET